MNSYDIVRVGLALFPVMHLKYFFPIYLHLGMRSENTIQLKQLTVYVVMYG